MSKIFPAATVVPVRDGELGMEVLMLRRSQQVSFAEGMWVFPGGRIDKADYRNDLDDIESAARYGAVRETLEEAQLAIDASELVYFAHWTTPPNNRRRYATWFFISEACGETENVVVDGSEIVEHRWYRPDEALADHRDKQIDILPPTFITLSELLGCETVAQALAMYRDRPVSEFQPRFTATDNGIAMLYAGDAGYETADQDAQGARHRCWLLDEAWRYEKNG